MTLVVGLTGGIGSGKSTVAKLFAELGANVIDSDQIARDLTQSGQKYFQAILKHFGPSVLLENGQLNRKALAQIIFKHPSEKLWLEALLHPPIREAMALAVKRSEAPYCILVIPLLLETSPNPLIHRILVVDASPELQLHRTKLRDRMTEPEVQAIIDSQASREAKLKAAHDLIQNDGKLADLKPQVEKLHQFYLSLKPL